MKPVLLDVAANRFHQEVMINLIKRRLDVKLDHQSNCQHRFRVTAIACFADLPGRYPKNLDGTSRPASAR